MNQMNQMNQLNYSEFTPSSYHSDIQSSQNAERQRLIKNHVMMNGYIELKSDYRNVDSYYYDKSKKRMYKVCNHCDWSGNVNPVFEISNDEHILQINDSLIQ